VSHHVQMKSPSPWKRNWPTHREHKRSIFWRINCLIFLISNNLSFFPKTALYFPTMQESRFYALASSPKRFIADKESTVDVSDSTRLFFFFLPFCWFRTLIINLAEWKERSNKALNSLVLLVIFVFSCTSRRGKLLYKAPNFSLLQLSLLCGFPLGWAQSRFRGECKR